MSKLSDKIKALSHGPEDCIEDMCNDWAAHAEALEAEVKRLRKEIVKADRIWLQGENERDALRAVIEKVRARIGQGGHMRDLEGDIIDIIDTTKEVPANGNI